MAEEEKPVRVENVPQLSLHTRIRNYLRLNGYSNALGFCYGIVHTWGFSYLMGKQYLDTMTKRLDLMDRGTQGLTLEGQVGSTELKKSADAVQEKMKQRAPLARLKIFQNFKQNDEMKAAGIHLNVKVEYLRSYREELDFASLLRENQECRSQETEAALSDFKARMNKIELFKKAFKKRLEDSIDSLEAKQVGDNWIEKIRTDVAQELKLERELRDQCLSSDIQLEVQVRFKFSPPPDHPDRDYDEEILKDKARAKFYTAQYKEMVKGFSEEEILLAELPAFLDRITFLHTEPARYSHLFERPLADRKEALKPLDTGQNAFYMSPMLPPLVLSDSDEIKSVSEFCYGDDKAGLTTFFTSLGDIFVKHNIQEPVMFVLDNCTHTNVVIYEPSEKKWLLLAIDNHRWAKDFCDPATLVDRVFTDFCDSDWTSFGVNVVAKKTGNHLDKVQAALNDWRREETKARHAVDAKEAKQPTLKQNLMPALKDGRNSKETKAVHKVDAKKAKQLTSKKQSLLYMAAAHGDIRTLEKCIKSGADPNQADNYGGWTALHRAVQKGKVEAVEKLLEMKGIKIDQPDNEKKTALDWAIQDRALEIIRRLVSKMEGEIGLKSDQAMLAWGVAKNQVEVVRIFLEGRERKKYDDSALLGWAVQNRHVNLVEALSEKGANVCVPLPPEDKTALHVAVDVEDIPILKQLIPKAVEEKKNIDYLWGVEEKESVLHLAVRTGKVEAVKTLLDSALYSHFNGSHRERNAVWNLAIQSKSIEIIRLLVNKSHKTELKNEEELLAWAAKQGEIEVVRVILGKEEKTEQDDKVILKWAVLNNQQEVVDKLFAKNMRSDYSNPYLNEPLTSDNCTALHLAAQNGYVKMVKSMVNYWEVDVEKKNDVGEFALDLAAAKGHVEVVRMLLGKRDGKEKDDNALLGWAAGTERVEIVKVLLAKGVNVDQLLFPGGWTALHVAAHNGCDEAVAVLLENHADPGQKNQDGLTAFDLARKAGSASKDKHTEPFSKIVTLLKKKEKEAKKNDNLPNSSASKEILEAQQEKKISPKLKLTTQLELPPESTPPTQPLIKKEEEAPVSAENKNQNLSTDPPLQVNQEGSEQSNLIDLTDSTKKIVEQKEAPKKDKEPTENDAKEKESEQPALERPGLFQRAWNGIKQHKVAALCTIGFFIMEGVLGAMTFSFMPGTMGTGLFLELSIGLTAMIGLDGLALSVGLVYGLYEYAQPGIGGDKEASVSRKSGRLDSEHDGVDSQSPSSTHGAVLGVLITGSQGNVGSTIARKPETTGAPSQPLPETVTGQKDCLLETEVVAHSSLNLRGSLE